MEHNDFDPFSDFSDNPSIPKYLLPLVSQCQNIQTSENEEEDELVKLQNSEAGDDDDILDFNMESEPEIGDEGQEVAKQQRKELSDDEMAIVYGFMLQKSVNGKLKRGTTTEVSRAFNISMRSIQKLWKRGKKSGNHKVSLNRVKNFERRRVQVDLEKIREILMRKRTTLRNLSSALGVSRGTVSSKLKSGELRRHTNAIKLILTEANRLQCIEHCLLMMDPDSEPSNHRDEKCGVHR